MSQQGKAQRFAPNACDGSGCAHRSYSVAGKRDV